MKPKLNPPGTKRLKVKCDILLSTSAFKFKLRRYIEAVAGPLIETIRNIKLEHYSLKRRESDFEDLMNCVVEIFLRHSSRRVLDACAGAVHYAATEGFEKLGDIGDVCRKSAFLQVTQKVQTALGGARAEAPEPPLALTDINEDEGHQFQIRVGLTRLNALVSLLPAPSADGTSPETHDVNKDLTAIIGDAANATSCVGVRSVALAARASSLVLVHRMITLVDRSKFRLAEVDELVSVRDAFLSNAVTLARDAVDLYPQSRILPKVRRCRLTPSNPR
jgi:cohesin complex subunit SA-1/2